MVVDESRKVLPSQEQVDRVFHALADATRRDILARTLRTESSVSALAHQYPMSFAAVQKHVAVLAAAGLVTKHRRGREQIVSTDIRALRTAAQLLDQLESIWRTRIDRLGDILAEPEGGAPQ
ncbi:MAG TPA: metalloregulator ArsR/SmtB family transcription factor [Ilumatobacteraceae bacterium]|jgi:DNA-binding transcriptional ArsR family regulator|nr:winged helix-turn-helix transcriptional regulator [Ilumatobacteraceae bacterium]HRC46575.1 metalloregulator ArsR/SmtB family transcription factor [Ilumatobacteraceae bacterium]